MSTQTVVTMQQLSQDTGGVIRRLNEEGRPVAVTHHGRFVAMLTPLANEQVESEALSAAIDNAENRDQLTGERSVGPVVSIDELLQQLGEWTS